MNFVADESVDGPIVDLLRSSGHSVVYIAEIEEGLDDDAVFELANKGRAVLLTEDKDFGEIVFRMGRIPHGVVLLRLGGLSNVTKAEVASAAITAHESDYPAPSRSFLPAQFAFVRVCDRNHHCKVDRGGLSAFRAAALAARQHFLYFKPLPHGYGSFLLVFIRETSLGMW